MRREIVIHSLAHAEAALAAAAECSRAVILASAPGAALYVGPAWFKAVIEQARERYPGIGATAVLDCGDEPGAVMAALRAGLRDLRFHGTAEVRQKLAEMGAIFAEPADRTLDLLEIKQPKTACAAFLGED